MDMMAHCIYTIFCRQRCIQYLPGHLASRRTSGVIA